MKTTLIEIATVGRAKEKQKRGYGAGVTISTGRNYDYYHRCERDRRVQTRKTTTPSARPASTPSAQRF